jgi:CRP-like cAMP-binding protein
MQLPRAHGRVTRAGIQLDLPLTQELLAQTTGSARETVSYALAREGFVVREGRRYRITVAPELLAQ